MGITNLNNIIMKKLLTITALFVGLIIAISSCKSESDYEKYLRMINEACSSPVTELVTPDKFNFNMSEDEYNSFIDSLPHKDIDDYTYWLFHIEDEVYAASFSEPDFFEEKLCKYKIWINHRIVNDSLEDLSPNDINKIVEHYKTSLGEECELAVLPERLITSDTYLLIKGNLAITITRSHSSGSLFIECENRPASFEVEYIKSESSHKIIAPTASVKNNKWNGGVKQVEDYLERTLRDPDSYESIEWSEVKTKDDGYYVRHKYRAKNGFGGMVVTNQLFHLDFSGNVVDVKDLY